jgi:hypothetical protein
MSGRDVVERIEKGDYFAEITRDDDIENPRTWHDSHIFTFICSMRNYTLGDLNCDYREYLRDNEINGGNAIIYIVHGYSHSGISLSLGSEWPFNCPWDSGIAGCLFIKKDEYEKKVSDKYDKDRSLAIAKAEIEEMNQYLNGDVYIVSTYKKVDYISKNGDKITGSEDLESCGGFYGLDWAKEEATSMLEATIKHDAEMLLKQATEDGIQTEIQFGKSVQQAANHARELGWWGVAQNEDKSWVTCFEKPTSSMIDPSYSSTKHVWRGSITMPIPATIKINYDGDWKDSATEGRLIHN